MRDTGAQLEDAAIAAAKAARDAAAAVEAERAALGEARREICVLAAAAGADKDTALAELKVGNLPVPIHSSNTFEPCDNIRMNAGSWSALKMS